MAATAESVVIEVLAKVDRAERNLSRFRSQFDNGMRGIQGSAARTELAVTRGMRNLAGAIGLVSTVALARGLLSIADQAKNLDAQLRLATSQTGNFAQATEDVRRIAESTRSSLGATADLYGSFQRNAKELGITQMQAARATETLTKTLTISGAGAGESAAAIRQFSQALASGVLRGDEFNSIMENAPRLARLLADSLGVPVGALRAMAEEGQLTADKLTAALTDQKFTDGIDAEFKQLPVTFDQAMEQIKNAAIITFGAFDRGGEFSTALANFITQGTGGFSDLEVSAENLGIEIRSTFAGLSDAFSPLVNGALDAFSTIGAEAHDLQKSIRSLLGTIDSIRNAPANALTYLSQRSAEAPGFLLRSLTDGQFTIEGARYEGPSTMERDYVRTQATKSAELREKQAGRTAGNWRDSGMFAGMLGAPVAPEVAGPPAARPAATKKKAKKGPSAETLARREEAARLAEERRQQAFDNENAGLDRDLLDARRALANSAEIVAQFERQEIEAERKRYADNIESQVRQKRLRDDGEHSEAELLRIKNDQLAAERTKLVDQREEERQRKDAVDRLDAQMSTEQELLGYQADMARTIGERREIELRILKLAFDRERQALQEIAANSKDAKERERARDRLAALPDLQAGAEASVRDRTRSPLDAYLNTIPKTAEEMNEAFEGVAANGLQSLTDGITEAIMGAKSLGDVFKAVAKQIIADLIRIAVQKTITNAIGSALNIPGFSGGGSVYIGGGGLPGLASGGSVYVRGNGGIDRNIMSINGQPVARVNQGERIDVVPQGKAINPVSGHAFSPAASAAPVAKVQLQLSGDIDAHIASVSGPIAIEVVRATAPGIVDRAKAETIGALQRPRL